MRDLGFNDGQILDMLNVLELDFLPEIREMLVSPSGLTEREAIDSFGTQPLPEGVN